MIDITNFGFRPGFNWENRFDIKTYIGNYLVSTIDLGIDHNLFGSVPLYYETMIFEVKNGKIDFRELYIDRYSTEEQATLGHKWVCEHIEEILKDSDVDEWRTNAISGWTIRWKL